MPDQPSNIWTGDEAEKLELAVDETIADCGGDMRAAVRALLIANACLEAARDRMIGCVSRGYVRGRLDERE
jgi:hypothetical protein